VEVLEPSDDELSKNSCFVGHCILEDGDTGSVVVPLKPELSEDSLESRVGMLVSQTLILGAQDSTLGHQVGIEL
jgi:hypothetical protein